MKKGMKTKYSYTVKTEYGDTETVRWDEDRGCWIGSSGRNYDESEFISFSKIKETKIEEEKGE